VWEFFFRNGRGAAAADRWTSLVLANLILSGVFCSIDFIYGEHFNKDLQNAILLLQNYSNLCKTKFIYLDDETYHNQKFPFVLSNSTK
jgi:hypothetical protein